MDNLLTLATSRDVKERLQGTADLEEYTKDAQLSAGDGDVLLKALPKLLKDHNAKVCQNAVSVLSNVIMSLGEDFKPYIGGFIPIVLEKMADTKIAVREKTNQVLQALASVVGPSGTLNLIKGCFTHKNFRAREQILSVWRMFVQLYGEEGVPPAKYLDEIVNLLSDQKVSVREAAMSCLDEVYRQWGPKLVNNLTNRGLRSAQLTQLKQRFASLEGGDDGNGHAADAEARVPTKLSDRPRTASSSSIGRKQQRITLESTDGDPAVFVTSAKELSTMLTKLMTTIRSASNHWKDRLDSLHQLSGLGRGNAVQDYDVIQSSLRDLVDPLITSVSDLRSQISRAGCTAVATLAKHLGSEFGSCAEQLMPALLKLPFVSTQVIALSGSKCISDVLTYCHHPRLIAHVIKPLRGRNVDLRVCCIGYLKHILANWHRHHLDRNAESIQDTIKVSLKDANNEVRRIARQAFWTFSAHYETRGQRIQSTLDPQTRRLLEQSQFDAEVVTPVNDDMTHDFPASKPRPSSAAASRSRQAASSQRSRHERAVANIVAFDEDDQAEEYLPPPQHHDDDFGGRVPPSRNTGNTRAASAAPRGGRREPVRDPSDDYVSYAEIHAGDRHAQRPPITVAHRNEHDETPVGPPRQAFGGDVRQQQPSASARSGASGPSRSRTKPAAAPASAGTRRQPPSRAQSASSSTRKAASATPAATAKRSSGPPSSAQQQQQQPAANVVDFGGEDLPSIFRKAGSEIWSTRIEAFLQIKAMVQSSPSKAIVPHFKKLVQVFDDHLPDPHYKVTLHAFDTLCEVMTNYRTSLEPYLERLVPKILLKLSDPKSMVRAGAGRALETLGECYETDILFPLLLRILEQRNPKVKQSALEFVLGLGRVDPNYFENGSHMRGYLLRLGGFSGDKSPDLRKVTMNILLDLFHSHTQVFVSQFIQLPTGLQHDMQGRLKPHLPQLAQAVREAKDARAHGGARTASAASTRHAGVESQYRNYDPYQTAAEASAARGGSSAQREQYPYHDDEFSDDEPTGRQYYEDEGEDVFGDYDEDADFASRQYYHQQAQAQQQQQRLGRRDNHGYPQQQSQGRAPSREAPRPAWSVAPSPAAAAVGGDPRLDAGGRPMPPLKSRACEPERAKYSGPFPHPQSPQKKKPGRSAPTPSTTTRGPAPQAAAAQAVSHAGAGYNPRAYQERELVVSNPDDPAQVVPQLLSQISLSDDPNARAEALHRLIKLSRSAKPSMWNQFFGRILLVVLEAANDRDSGVRELAILLIKEMLRNQSHGFADFLEVVVSRLLETYRDPAREVTQAGEDTIGQLIKSQPIQRCLEVLIPTVISEDGPVLLGSLKALSKIVKVMPPEDLLAQLPAILPGVFEAFKNPNADIRKAVVFCLVDMYLVLGDQFTPFLGELNTSQLKLVTIYINRLVKTR